MARSPSDDPIYNDMQHNAWNYREAENCASGSLSERKKPISPTASVMGDNSMYANGNFTNDVYMGKHQFNVPAGDAAASNDDKMAFNSVPNVTRVNCQNYGNAMLNLGNGQRLRVFYDENNQQLIFPMSGQYELFNHNQGLRDMPLQTSQPSHMFTLNQEYSLSSAPTQPPPAPLANNYAPDNNTQNVPTSNFLKEVLGNWEPNSTGTYSPFGQNYPLNHPDAPTLNLHPNNPVMDPINQVKAESSPKRNENSPLADTSNKKRIVAEVKPMRPTYSDVLAKNTKNNSQTEATRRVKPQNIEVKPSNNKTAKPDKPTAIRHDENKQKSEKKLNSNTISSGSESGDINTDDTDKRQKPNKKSKNKRNNISRKWSSLDDITNEEDASYNENESQFVFIENQSEKPSKKEKKSDNKSKNAEKHSKFEEDDFKLDEEDDQSQFVYQDGQTETKSRKKKESRIYYKAAKPSQDKKKAAQTKFRRNKPGYLGLAQNYLEHWGGASWMAIIWFVYLLSDICRMSAHLMFDL